MRARLYTQGYERTAKFVHIVAELAVGSCVIKRGVFKGVLVGKFLHHSVKHLRKGFVYKQIFLPDIFSGVGAVVVKG